MAATNYLHFLKEGRKIILQDAALLQDRFPQYKLFNMPCFKSPPPNSPGTDLQQKWADFKEQVQAAHNRSLEQSLQVILSSCLCSQVLLQLSALRVTSGIQVESGHDVFTECTLLKHINRELLEKHEEDQQRIVAQETRVRLAYCVPCVITVQ